MSMHRSITPPAQFRDRGSGGFPSYPLQAQEDEVSFSNHLGPSFKQEPTTPPARNLSVSTRTGVVDGKYKEAFKNYDVIKQYFAKTETMNEQFQKFLDVIREKLGVRQDHFRVVKKGVIAKIDELLKDKDVIRESEKGIAERDREIAELKVKCNEYREQIEAVRKGDGKVIEEVRELFKNKEYVFDKSSVTTLLQGLEIKKEEMADIDKIQIDCKGKRVVVEYMFDKTVEGLVQKGKEDVWKEVSVCENSAKTMWKMATQLANRFVKINYFLLYNITDFYRFIKEKDTKSTSLTKIYSDLEAKENELKKVQAYLQEKELDSSRKMPLRDVMDKTNPFLQDLVKWWDESYKVLKEIYQNLSKDTMTMIKDLKGKGPH